MKHKRKDPIHYRIHQSGSTAKRQQPRRRYAGLAVFVLLAGMVGLGLHLVSQPVQGHNIAAVDVKPKVQTVTLTPNLPMTTAQSVYFQLALPAGYQAQAANQSAPLLYQQTLIKPSDQGSLIIVLEVLNGGTFSASSSYTSELQQPARYHFTSKSIDGDTVAIADDVQSGAVVAFWPHGNYLATIGISSGVDNLGSDDSTELAALLPLLTAWRWR
jgi:hypothetical protein